MSARVLVVDDDSGVRFTVRGALEDAGYTVEDAPSGPAALARMEPFAPDVLVTDLRMPGMDGQALLTAVKARHPSMPVILMTAHGSERAAVDAMKGGAWDYLRKPFELDELIAVVQRALESVHLRADNERLTGELNLSRSMIFESPAMSRLATLVQRVGPRDVTVLVTGESGTGKERVAEAIVRASRRSARPFLRFNCASLSPELAEAELFGHSRGAFTGAHRPRVGLFREADGGTVLLDEVAELDLGVQAKLLRVLQEGEVRPIGEDHPRKVDVRVIAATHRDLRQLIVEGRFREDVFYRLNVVNLHVPALRERPEDIAALARHFLARSAERFATGPIREPPGFVAALVAREWPGNVRELENAIEMLVALSHEGELDAALLPGSTDARPIGLGLKERMDAYERGLVVEALRQANDSRAEAARLLGISRVTLYDKLKKHVLAAPGDAD